MIKFDIITIFPYIFDSYINESIIKRAQKKKLIEIKVHNLRDWAEGKHKQVDDSPYGGGPGMVFKIEPIFKAVKHLKAKSSKLKARVVLFSTRGKKLDSKTAQRLSQYGRLIMICGRYEGVDERAAKYIADEEISIGDYVLSGGELPAMVLTEAVSRYIPGVLGKYESLEDIKGSYPAYTKPAVFKPQLKAKSLPRSEAARGSKLKAKEWKVPEVLLSGDHKKIDEWRRKHSR